MHNIIRNQDQQIQINQIEKVVRMAAQWNCRRWQNTSRVCKILDEIHCGAVSVEKDKYLTPVLFFLELSHVGISPTDHRGVRALLS